MWLGEGRMGYNIFTEESEALDKKKSCVYKKLRLQ